MLFCYVSMKHRWKLRFKSPLIPLSFLIANVNTGQHYPARRTAKQQECFIFASDMQKKHMDINGKIWQKILNEGQETEKMGKKCMHVTDIYKMCGSSQASGTKRPQSLNLSKGLTHVSNHVRQKKILLKKKKSCLTRLYRADIYSRTWLFQRPSRWAELQRCTQAGTRALLSTCHYTTGVCISK